MQEYKIFSTKVHSIEQSDVYDYILKLSERDKTAHVVLLDTYLLIKTIFNKELRKIINTADLVLPISGGVRFGLKFLKKPVARVYNYYNFLITLLLHYTDHAKYVYLLGGKKKYIHNVEKNIQDSFPGIRLIGKFHADYKKQFEKDLLTAIQKATPALILVGMESPKQEKWISQKRNKFKNGVFIGVGDFINTVGGNRSSSAVHKSRSGIYKINRKLKNPLRIFYFPVYFVLLLSTKLFGKEQPS